MVDVCILPYHWILCFINWSTLNLWELIVVENYEVARSKYTSLGFSSPDELTFLIALVSASVFNTTHCVLCLFMSDIRFYHNLLMTCMIGLAILWTVSCYIKGRITYFNLQSKPGSVSGAQDSCHFWDFHFIPHCLAWIYPLPKGCFYNRSTPPSSLALRYSKMKASHFIREAKCQTYT